MTPIIITAFVAQSGGTAAGPGVGTNSANLQLVRAPNAAAKGPNDTLFQNPQNGALMMTLSDVIDTIAADLPKGKTVQIIIQDIPAPAATT